MYPSGPMSAVQFQLLQQDPAYQALVTRHVRERAAARPKGMRRRDFSRTPMGAAMEKRQVNAELAFREGWKSTRQAIGVLRPGAGEGESNVR